MCTLRSRCLNVIIENLDRYIYAYHEPRQDFGRILLFEHLRRKYSLEIAQSLHEKNSFRIQYIDFILNRFLKSLDTNWLLSFPCDIISIKLKEIGSSLEEVHFGADRPWVDIICHLSNVITMSFTECNDLHLEAIAKFCPKIQSIKCIYSALNKFGFKHICCQENGIYPCPKLKVIVFGFSTEYVEGITDVHIGYLLKNLRSLEKIEHTNLPEILYSIHKDDINRLDQVEPYNLTDIKIDWEWGNESWFDDMLKILVYLCPHLTCFSCPVVTDEQLNLCSQLPIQKLNLMSLTYSRGSPLCLNNFLTLKGSLLTSLHLQFFAISINCVLQNCRNLITFHMSHCEFRSGESGNNSTLSRLKDLAIEDMRVTNAVTLNAITSLLSSSPNIESFSIHAVEMDAFVRDIQDAIMNCCERNKLENIDLSYTSIDIGFVENILRTCSTLCTLNLKRCDFNDEQILRLQNIAKTLPNKVNILHK